jgi:hypothetical protein
MSNASMQQPLSESAVRRRAGHVGLRLRKFRGSPEDAQYGTYALVDGQTGALVAAAWPLGFGLSLSAVDDVLPRTHGPAASPS